MSDPMRESGEERQAREAEIAERLKGISPAPWQTDPRFHGKVYCDDSLGSMVADCSSAYTLAVSHLTEEANAAFIANAPSDLSYLLAEVSILRERLETEKLNERAAGYRWGYFDALCIHASTLVGNREFDSLADSAAKHYRECIQDFESGVSSPLSEVTRLEDQ